MRIIEATYKRKSPVNETEEHALELTAQINETEDEQKQISSLMRKCQFYLDSSLIECDEPTHQEILDRLQELKENWKDLETDQKLWQINQTLIELVSQIL